MIDYHGCSLRMIQWQGRVRGRVRVRCHKSTNLIALDSIINRELRRFTCWLIWQCVCGTIAQQVVVDDAQNDAAPGLCTQSAQVGKAGDQWGS